MAEGNPIRFSDLFNFDDTSGVKNASQLIVDLNDSYKSFIETIMGASWDKLANQQKEIADSAKQMVDQISKVNQSTKEGQDLLVSYTETMQQNEKAVKNVIDAKRGLKATEDIAANSVKALKAEYKSLQDQYEKLNPAEKEQGALMKILAMSAQDVKDKITGLSIAFKTTTEVIKAAAGSYAALEADNKKLLVTLKNMEGGMNADNAAATALKEQIFKNTQALKEFDAQINIHNRNVGNYLNDIMEAQRLRKELEQLAAAGQKDTQTFTNLNNQLGTLTSGMGGLANQLTWVDSQMVTLANAGRMDSEEFIRLAALSKELKADIAGLGVEMESSFVKASERGVEKIKELLVTFFLLSEAINFFEGIKEGVEQAERATVQLHNTLDAFGKADVFDEIKEKVEKIREEFKYLGEAEVEMVFSKLITYAKLSSEQIEQLIPVIINFAAKQKVTIEEGASLFLKALEGQGRGLKELGINVKDGANEIERFGIIMNELAPKVEGAAKAFEDSDSGRIAGFTRKIKDLQIQIGDYMLPILAALASTLGLLPLGPITAALGLLTAAMIAQYTYTKLTTEGTVLYNLVQRAKVGWDALATTAQVAYTQALVLFTGETRAATAAQLAFNAAEAANPLTAVIAILAIAGAAVYAYASKVRGATEAVHKEAEADLVAVNAKKVLNEVHLNANRAVSEEIAAVNKLVEVIKHHSNTLDDRNKAMEKLVALNKEHLSGLTLQNIETEKGIKILDDYISKLEQTAYAEALQNKLFELEKQKVENNQKRPVTLTTEQIRTAGEGQPGDLSLAEVASIRRLSADFYKKDREIQAKIDAVLNQMNGNPNVHNNSSYEGGADTTAKDARAAMEQKLKDAETFYEKWNNIVKAGYENSKKTETDEISLEEANLTIARDLYKQRLGILDTYYKGVGKLDKKQKEDREKNDNALAVSEIKATQALNKIQDKLNKDYEERERHLKDNIEKIRQSKRELENLNNEFKQDKSDAEKVNPLFAAFGIEETEDPNKKYDRKLKRLHQKRQDEEGKAINGSYTMSDKTANLAGIDTDIKDTENNKELDATKRLADNKKEIWQKATEFGMNLEKSFFDLKAKNIEREMQATEAAGAFALNLAGNNTAGKIRIERDTQNKMMQLRRQQAQAEKSQAEFTAIIDTYKGVAAAISEGPPQSIPLAAIALASGLANVAIISSKSLPSYWKGRGYGIDEFARVNELGPELIESKRGFRVAGGGGETITHLKSDEIVHTHKESVDIMQKNKWLDSLLRGTGAYRQREEDDRRALHKTVAETISKDDYKQAMIEAISTMPQPVIQQPAQDVQDRHIRQQLRNGL